MAEFPGAPATVTDASFAKRRQQILEAQEKLKEARKEVSDESQEKWLKENSILGSGDIDGAKMNFMMDYLGLHETYGAMIRSQGIGKHLDAEGAKGALNALQAFSVDGESVRGAVVRMGIDPDSDDGVRIMAALDDSLRVNRLQGREVRALANASAEDLRSNLRTALFGRLAPETTTELSEVSLASTR